MGTPHAKLGFSIVNYPPILFIHLDYPSMELASQIKVTIPSLLITVGIQTYRITAIICMECKDAVFCTLLPTSSGIYRFKDLKQTFVPNVNTNLCSDGDRPFFYVCEIANK